MTDESTFYKRSEAWLARLLEMNPVAATQLGEHRWDDRLADYAIEALESQYQELLTAQAEFQGMDTSGFRVDARIDHTVVVQIIKNFIRGYEKLQTHRRNPGSYLDEVLGGVVLLLLKEFAPLPERLRSVLGRVREAPRVLGQCQQNIAPAEVPPVWAEIALEEAEQAPGLFMGLLPYLTAEAAPELQAEMAEAGQVAAQAVEELITWLQTVVVPQAAGDFAAGRELFDEMLREDHMVDYDAEQLLATGWEQFRQTQVQMEAVAREIDPNKTVHDYWRRPRRTIRRPKACCPPTRRRWPRSASM